MSTIIKTIQALPNLLSLKAATSKEIIDAELQIRTSFSDEYKEYLAAFGAIIAYGVELSGIAKAEHRNVVLLTKRERELNSNVPNTMYVVENSEVDGIIIWQDTNGIIYKTTPNSQPKQIAKSLSDYLKK